MGRRHIDITGQRFHRLRAVKYLGLGKWECVCDCGNTKTAEYHDLSAGKVKSCGCMRKEMARTLKYRHGEAHDRLYMVWLNMKTRCYNPNSSRYYRYGARGIKVCQEWLDYETFRAWAIESGYDRNAKYGECTIDRIDVDGDYEPSNCRWADLSTQSKNKAPYRNPSCWRPVESIDECGNVIKRYQSITDAASDTGCRTSSISAVCRGKYKKSLGIGWRYADN